MTAPEEPDEPAVSIHVETTDDGVRVRLDTGTRWVVLELPRDEAQRLAMVLLHHAGTDEGRVPS